MGRAPSAPPHPPRGQPPPRCRERCREVGVPSPRLGAAHPSSYLWRGGMVPQTPLFTPKGRRGAPLLSLRCPHAPGGGRCTLPRRGRWWEAAGTGPLAGPVLHRGAGHVRTRSSPLDWEVWRVLHGNAGTEGRLTSPPRPESHSSLTFGHRLIKIIDPRQDSHTGARCLSHRLFPDSFLPTALASPKALFCQTFACPAPPRGRGGAVPPAACPEIRRLRWGRCPRGDPALVLLALSPEC